MGVLLVHNPSAGAGEVSTHALMARLRTCGFDPVPCSSDDGELQTALAQQWDFVIAAGGDGTVAKVATMLPDRSVPLAILPLGTVNNIAHTFGVEPKIEQVAAGWRAGRKAVLDVGIVEGAWGSSCFLEAVGFGALTQALGGIHIHSHSMQEKLAIGRAAFRTALVQSSPAGYHLKLDGESVQADLLMLEVLNIPAIGPRLVFAPEADPGDGMLEVVTATAGDRNALLTWIDAPEGPVPLRARRVREVEILAGPDCVRIDDPKRARPTGRSKIKISLSSEPVTLLLPGHRREQHGGKGG